MEVYEKRELLDAVDILVKRPASANEVTLGTALAHMKKLVEALTNGQLSILVVEVGKEQNDG